MDAPVEASALTREATPRSLRTIRAIAWLAVALTALTAAAVVAARAWPVRVVAGPSGAPPPAPRSYSLSVPIEIEVHPAPSSGDTATAPALLLGACPDPEPRADRAVGPRFGAGDDVDGTYQLDGAALAHVTASPTRAGWLATWSEDAIFLSRDDGRTFERVLAPPGKIESVRIDCHDNVLALASGGWLGRRTPDGSERWRELSFLKPARDEDGDYDEAPARLAVGGGLVGLFTIDYNAHVTMALSGDGGATWRFQRIENEMMEYLHDAEIDASGIVRVGVTLGDCMWDGVAFYVVDGRTGATTGSGDLTAEGLIGLAHDRWVYATSVYDCEGALCGLAPGTRQFVPVRGAHGRDPESDDYLYLVTGPRDSYAIDGRRVDRVRRGRLTKLAGDLPADVTWQTIDGNGRLLGLTEDGALVRWSHKHGARLLHGARQEY